MKYILQLVIFPVLICTEIGVTDICPAVSQINKSYKRNVSYQISMFLFLQNKYSSCSMPSPVKAN